MFRDEGVVAPRFEQQLHTETERCVTIRSSFSSNHVLLPCSAPTDCVCRTSDPRAPQRTEMLFAALQSTSSYPHPTAANCCCGILPRPLVWLFAVRFCECRSTLFFHNTPTFRVLSCEQFPSYGSPQTAHLHSDNFSLETFCFSPCFSVREVLER